LTMKHRIKESQTKLPKMTVLTRSTSKTSMTMTVMRTKTSKMKKLMTSSIWTIHKRSSTTSSRAIVIGA
jgi:hypothetical protein